MKKTPFYERMLQYGAKMVEFTGYSLPIQFEGSGIIAEHKAVRENVGIFDVSHMGELVLTGKNAFDTIQKLITNDITSMKDGVARYSPMTNDKGGIVDDILVYKFSDEKYMLVVNAANCEKDDKWVSGRLIGDTKFENISEKTAQLAIQGKNAENVIKEFIAEDDIPQKNYTFKKIVFQGENILRSRTGYTGEDGFEIYCDASKAETLFDILMEKGKKYDIKLCGLGARDTLRLEAAMPLYGHEMNDDTLASEIGLNFFIKMDKEDFSGKKALESTQPKYKRIGLKVVDRGIAREHCIVFDGEREIGYITSGTFAPTLGYAIAMARVEKDFSGEKVYIEVRNKKLLAEKISLPFYKRK